MNSVELNKVREQYVKDNPEEQINEEPARDMDICLGCGEEKSDSCIVCWGCFKYDDNPFKYWNGTFNEWLKTR